MLQLSCPCSALECAPNANVHAIFGHPPDDFICQVIAVFAVVSDQLLFVCNKIPEACSAAEHFQPMGQLQRIMHMNCLPVLCHHKPGGAQSFFNLSNMCVTQLQSTTVTEVCGQLGKQQLHTHLSMT